MLLQLDIEESSRVPMHNGVAVCKNTAKNQVYCILSDDRHSMHFAAFNNSLWDIGYDNSPFFPFYTREN